MTRKKRKSWRAEEIKKSRHGAKPRTRSGESPRGLGLRVRPAGCGESLPGFPLLRAPTRSHALLRFCVVCTWVGRVRRLCAPLCRAAVLYPKNRWGWGAVRGVGEDRGREIQHFQFPVKDPRAAVATATATATATVGRMG
jgi:hypothetical protein